MAILIMMSILYYTNTMSLILIVLFPLLVDMSLHFDTSFKFSLLAAKRIDGNGMLALSAVIVSLS
jgi:hypothetical protein